MAKQVSVLNSNLRHSRLLSLCLVAPLSPLNRVLNLALMSTCGDALAQLPPSRAYSRDSLLSKVDFEGPCMMLYAYKRIRCAIIK